MNIFQDMPSEPASQRKRKIGERLRMTRLALGYGDQGEYAKRANIAPNTYNQWEKGKHFPRQDLFEQLLDTYTLTSDWIMRGDMSGLRTSLSDSIRHQQAEQAKNPKADNIKVVSRRG